MDSMINMSKDQQVKQAVEGLALGVLSFQILRIPNKKMQLELAFNSAWRSWPRAGEFSGIRGIEAGNAFWLGMGKSAGRRGATAAWDQHSVPYLMPGYEHWGVDECLDHISDEKASAEDWKILGESFLRALHKAQAENP